MRVSELPSRIRRPLTAALFVAFFWVVFAAVPAELIDLNEALGWPRWESDALRVAGAALMLLGVAVFTHTFLLFARFGKGTPVPANPPKRFVTRGLFRYSRNPMYVAYALTLIGEFLWFGHATLLAYVGVYIAACQAVIVWWEEPVLRRRFGEEYARYLRTVRRWL
jgi:protein-S-isoprenylcysteine O-methyltransferase Ste14